MTCCVRLMFQSDKRGWDKLCHQFSVTPWFHCHLKSHGFTPAKIFGMLDERDLLCWVVAAEW